MPRRNGNGRARRHDSRPSFYELSRILGLNVRQKIAMMRYFKEKGGEQKVRSK